MKAWDGNISLAEKGIYFLKKVLLNQRVHMHIAFTTFINHPLLKEEPLSQESPDEVATINITRSVDILTYANRCYKLGDGPTLLLKTSPVVI